MKSFLLKQIVQAWVNVLLMAWVVMGCFLLLILQPGHMSLPYIVSLLAGIVLFLVYNWWVSDALNKNRK
jgi:putative flippase GtrA